MLVLNYGKQIMGALKKARTSQQSVYNFNLSITGQMTSTPPSTITSNVCKFNRIMLLFISPSFIAASLPFLYNESQYSNVL